MRMIKAIERKQAKKDKIEQLEDQRYRLMNMMTCRIVRQDLDRNTQELVWATGFDRRTIEAIYRPGSWMIRYEEARWTQNT